MALLKGFFNQFLDDNGNPLSGGKLFSFQAGTTTLLNTFTDQSGTTANANPVILDSAGRASIWLGTSDNYKFVLYDSDDNLIDTIDNVTAFNDSSPVGTSRLDDEAVTTAKLADDAVTSDKIGDDQVATNNLADDAVTRDKIAEIDKIPAGTVQMFHTFNGSASIPRGWMIMNGDVVNVTNYEATHGTGTYATDGVGSSVIDGKNLPNMANKYAVGTATTTQTGASSITSVGNTNHSSSGGNHSHPISATDQLTVSTASANKTFQNISGGQTRVDDSVEISGSQTGFLVGAASASSLSNVNGIFAGSMYAVLSGATSGNTITLDVQPESIEFIYIMKVV